MGKRGLSVLKHTNTNTTTLNITFVPYIANLTLFSIFYTMARPGLTGDAHLAAGHVGHGPVGLDGLQLVQAPVQLLQRLQ